MWGLKIYTPHPPALENAFWPEMGGGGLFNFSLENIFRKRSFVPLSFVVISCSLQVNPPPLNGRQLPQSPFAQYLPESRATSVPGSRLLKEAFQPWVGGRERHPITREGWNCRFQPPPTLSFLSLVVWFLPRKTPKFTKDFLPLPNPQNAWKRQRKHLP